MKIVLMTFGADPSIVLAAAKVGGVSASDAGAYFVTKDRGYTIFCPDEYHDAVLSLVANPPAEAPAPVPEEVSKGQFTRAVVAAKIISEDEGRAFLKVGDLPAMMMDAFSKIPDDALRLEFEFKAIAATSFSRSDRVFKELVKAGAATDEQIDDVFRLAASLT